MSLWKTVASGLRVLAHRDAADRDATDEVAHYVELATAAHVARGLSPDAARRAAELEIGNSTVTREEVRAVGWENAVDTFLGDVRFALRRLRTNPGFTAVGVITLSLGIGATTAVFSAVNPILLQPLPYPHAEQLVTLSDLRTDGSPNPSTFGTYAELRVRSRAFSALAVADKWLPSLTKTSEPERLVGQRVSASYFHTLGVAPAAGRDFLDGDDQVGGPNVAILSDRLVQRRFGGDQSIVGRRVQVEDDEYLVIGVMPRGYVNVITPLTDIWAPMQARATASFNSREWGHHYQIVGRLAPSVTAERAASEIESIGRSPVPQFPRPLWADMSKGLLVRSLKDEVTGETKPALFAIVGAVLLLLAIACVNVTNLLVARSAQRRGEFAMRAALGAGRGRLLRQLLTESLVLALLGGALGLGVALVGVRALVALSPPGLPRVEAIALNGPVFVFAFAATLVIGVIVGLVPALGAGRADLRAGTHAASRGLAGGRSAARATLVVTEVALALVLLVSAGLLMRSLARLFGVSPGFTSSQLLTMRVIEAGRVYRSDSARGTFFEQALDAVKHVPGVTAAAFTSQLPLSDDLDGYGYEFQARPTAKAGEDGSALRYAISPGYFAAMGIPLRRGRLFDDGDIAQGRNFERTARHADGSESVVISESLARRIFGDQNPIGARARFGPETGSSRGWDIVVGVVGDVKQQSLAFAETDAFYVLADQWWWSDDVRSLVVRTTRDAATLAPEVKRAIWSVDANQPIQKIATMDALISASASQRRFAFIVIESFAVAALLLAAVGLYGVISGGVTERVREIGIRTALGATSANIVRQVVGRGMLLVVAGVTIGLGGAVAASRLLESLLFGVSRVDPLTYVGVALLLGGVAVLASWAPARRASRIDPSITLRSE
jgi:predicted permease